MTADAAIDSNLIVLYNNWGPGPEKFREEIVGDFLDTARYQNVSTEEFPLGTVYAVRNSGDAGVKGWSELMYLRCGTLNSAVAVAAKTCLVQDSATIPFYVTNDPDSCIHLPSGRVAVALTAMTTDYYGWFWVGGVCPEDLVSGLGSTYATNGDVIAGDIRAVDLTADAIGFGPAQTPGSAACTTNCGPCGYVLAADA